MSKPPARPGQPRTACRQRTAASYWLLAEAAEKRGHIDRAREFVALAMRFEGCAASGERRDGWSLRRPQGRPRQRQPRPDRPAPVELLEP